MTFKKFKQYIALQKQKKQNQGFISNDNPNSVLTSSLENQSSNILQQPILNNVYSHTKARLPLNKHQEKPVTQLNMLTAGSVISTRRKELGLSLKRIASDTKIQEKYLQDIEDNKFEGFESAVFLNGFIKIYADYLELDVPKVSALFRRQIKSSNWNKTKVVKKRQHRISSLLTPNNLIITMAGLFLIVVGGYISIQFANFKRAPYLEITYPTNKTSSDVKEFELKGITEEATSIYVNDTEVNVNDKFKFSTIINLREGSNTIIIEAVKKSNQQNTSKKTLSINYEPKSSPNTEVIENEIVPNSYILKVETVDTEVWLQLTVDGKQELAQVLASNQTREFTFEDEVTLSTGRPSSTRLYINGEAIELNIDFTTGTGKITCNIRSNGYLCN